MLLTSHDVERLEVLARLALSPDEREAMLHQLNGFFRIVDRMSAVDTQGVEPLATPLSAIQDDDLRLRDDRVSATDIDPTHNASLREQAQRSAPLVHEGLYLVPRVVE
jgi:aspartyl-tRNA(Asn)/glutamyl-tRNA(Gln) amidotransferase subunit C